MYLHNGENGALLTFLIHVIRKIQAIQGNNITECCRIFLSILGFAEHYMRSKLVLE